MQTSRLLNTQLEPVLNATVRVRAGACASPVPVEVTVTIYTCVCMYVQACAHNQLQPCTTASSWTQVSAQRARATSTILFSASRGRKERTSRLASSPIHKVPPGSLLQRRGTRGGRGSEWLAQLSARQREGGEQ